MKLPPAAIVSLIFLPALLLASAPGVWAQAATGAAPQPGEDRPLEPGWALGVGAGIVQSDEAGETYLSANLRHRLGTRGEPSRSAEGRAARLCRGRGRLLEGRHGDDQGQGSATSA